MAPTRREAERALTPLFDAAWVAAASLWLGDGDPTVAPSTTGTAGSLDGARSYARVLHHRVHQQLDGQLTPQLNDVRELIPVATTDVADGVAT